MAKKNKIKNILQRSMRYIEPLQTTNLHADYGRQDRSVIPRASDPYADSKFGAIADDLVERLVLSEQQSINVVKGGGGLGETKRALAKAQAGAPIHIYDIENVGQPSVGSPFGVKKSMLGITQVAIGRARNQEALAKGEIDIDNAVFGLTPDVAKELTTLVDRLEKDYHSYYNMTPRERGSLASMTTFSNASQFGQSAKIGGTEFMTLPEQELPVPETMAGLTSPEAIKRIRQGITNMTDPNKVTGIDKVSDLFGHSLEQGAVLGGHNVQNHDQPSVTQVLKEINAPDKIVNYVKEPQVDTLLWSQDILNRPNTSKVTDYKLGTLHKEITNNAYGEGQAHNAGFDVGMNMSVYNELMRQSQNIHAESETYAVGDEFQVERFLGFSRSSFNKHRGQFDVVTKVNPDTGKHELQYENFRRATGRGGTVFQFKGELEPVDIEGVTHYGVSFYDPEQETYHQFLRTNRSEIDDIFNNHLVKAGDMTDEQIDYINKDNMRKRYSEYFTDPTKNVNDTVISRIEDDLKIARVFDDELSAIYDEGITSGAEELAAQRALETINADREDYKYGLKRVREVAGMRDRLFAEENFWKEIDAQASSVAGTAGDTLVQTKRKNLYFRNIYQTLEETHEKMEYGYGEMEVLNLPIVSNPGEFTHPNVQSRGQIESLVRNQLNKDMDRAGRGKTSIHFHNLMSTVGEGLDDEELNHLKRIVDKDLKNGKVNPGTINEVADTIYRKKELLKAGGIITNSVPGSDIETPFAVSILQDGSELAGKTVQQHKIDLHNEASDKLDRFIARGSNPQGNVKHGPLLERTKKSNEIQKQLRENVIGANASLGLKNGKAKIFSDSKAEDEIEKILMNFRQEGFQVRLEQVDGSDRVVLFASPVKGEAFDRMTFNELEDSPEVFMAPLPLYNDNSAIDTVAGEMKDVKKTRINPDVSFKNITPKDVTLESTSEGIFRQIGYSPGNIKKYLEEGETVESAIRISQGSLYRRSTELGVPSGYRTNSAKEMGYLGSSVLANQQLLLDQSEFYEKYAEEFYPEKYELFKTRKQNGQTDNILNIFNSGERAKFKQEANSFWLETIAPATGIQTFSEGINPNQSSRGIVRLTPPQLALPFGQMHSGIREQANKAVNYRTINEGPLKRYFDETQGSDSLVAQISTAPAQTSLGTRTKEESGIRSYEINTLRTSNEVLAEATPEVRKIFQDELDDLIDRKEGNTSRAKQTRDVLSLIDSGMVSTDEDEYALAQELLDSIKSSQKLEIDLGPYELDDNINNFLKQNLEDKLVDGELPAGKIMFDAPLDTKAMKNIGVLNRDNVLTVGQLMQDVVMDETGIEYGDAKRKRLEKGALFEGVEIMPNGKVKLFLDNAYEGMDGHKTIRTHPGTRETAKGVPQRLLSAFGQVIAGDSNIQAITSFEKHGVRGRRGTGSAYADLISTSAHNVASAIDSLYTDGSSGLGIVDDYFEGKKLSGNRMTDYQDFVQNKFVKDINDVLGSEQIAFNQDATQPFEFSSHSFDGTPEERQRALIRLRKMSTSQYGINMTEDYAVTRTGFRLHNVDNWQGTSSEIRYGAVELNLMEQAFRGPSQQKLEEIQSKGIVDGVDLSQYQGFTMKPGESIITRNFDLLSATEGNPEEIAEYARHLSSARKFQESGATIDSIQNSGNVIVDIAGTYEFEKDSNFLTIGEGDDQFTVVDGSRINIAPKDGLPSGAEMRNTYSNLYSVSLYGEGVETTIGDLVEEQNSSVFAQLVAPNSPQANNAALKNEVVEVVPMLRSSRDTLGDTFLRESESAQVRAMEHAYQLAHGTIPEGVSEEGIRKWEEKRLRGIKTNLEAFSQTSGRQLASDLPKTFQEIRMQNSLSANIAGRNILNTNYGINEVELNKRQIETLIRGRTGTILDANEVGLEDILKYSKLSEDEFKLLSDSKLEEIEERYILERLTGPRQEDDSFELFSEIKRDPASNELSIGVVSARYNPLKSEKDDTIGLDNRQAANLGGDMDGDRIGLSTYSMLENMLPEEARQAQEELRNMAEYTSVIALSEQDADNRERMSRERKNSYLELEKIENKADIETVFGDQLTDVNSLLQTSADENMISNIGVNYNTLVGTRDAISVFSNFATLAAGDNIIADDMRRLSSESTRIMDLIEQSAKDSKKMTYDQVAAFHGLSPDEFTPEIRERLHRDGKLVEMINEFDKGRTTIASSIQNMTTDNADEVFENIQRLGILNYGDTEEELLRKQIDSDAVYGMAQLNEAMAGTALRGFDNDFLRVGFSTADENRMKFEETMRENPAQIPQTRDTRAFAEMIFAEEPDVLSKWDEEAAAQQTSVIDNLSRIIGRNKESTTGQGQSETLINQLANARISESSGDRIRSSSGLYNQFKEGVSGVAQSTAFRAAAGVTAAWTVARAMKSGPTPEGNEAEQEYATAEEVAPSQLLTSPTARIQPGAQGVNLTVQASGNLSEQEVAGLINNEIGAMTGSPMEMNIHVNDNTARLDNKFYQRVVDKTFGF